MVAPLVAVGVGLGSLLANSVVGEGRRRGRKRQVADVRGQFDVTGEQDEGSILSQMRALQDVGVDSTPILDKMLANVQRQGAATVADDRREAAAVSAYERGSEERGNVEQSRRETAMARVQNQVRPIVQPAIDTARQFRQMQGLGDDSFSDTARINLIARMLNPGEIQTKEDVMAFEAGDPRLSMIPERILNKALSGELLTGGERGQIEQLAARLVRENQRSAKLQAQPYIDTAEAFEMNSDLIWNPDTMIPDAVLNDVLFREQPPSQGVPDSLAPTAAPAAPVEGKPGITYEELMRERERR